LRGKVLALINDPGVVRRILRHLDLPAELIVAAPARAPSQESFPDWSERPSERPDASQPEDYPDPIPPDDFDPGGPAFEG